MSFKGPQKQMPAIPKDGAAHVRSESFPEKPRHLPVMEEFDRMEKEQTLWDWFSDGLGSSVLCGGKIGNIQVMERPQYRKSPRKLVLDCKGMF